MPSKTSRHCSHQWIPRRNAWIGSGLACVAAAGALAAGAPIAGAAAQTPLLSQGGAGSAVSRLQRALHVASSGRFDAGTKHAVITFQRRDGLSVDGIVGPQTWSSLLGSNAGPTASPATASTSNGGYAIPAAIVLCESGGNYSAVNPQSGAGGAYQILPSTWQAYGGHGSPQSAPKVEQDRIAVQIYARQGRSAWTC